jgi:hypothetical protein
MTKGEIAVKTITIASPYLLLLKVTNLFKFGDNLLNRALGDSHLKRYITKPHCRVAHQAYKHMPMIAQERPSGLFEFLHRFGREHMNHKSAENSFV